MNSYCDQNSPYKKLFIYYLEGKFKEDEYDLGEYFIGNWEEDNYSFLFFHRPSLKRVTDLADTHLELSFIDHYQMDYDQWQHGPFHPLNIGRITISYSWQPLKPINGNHLIQLDPGLVFGSGSHPTTRHCLEAIQWAFSNEKIKRVLDLGTGSGVLALACAALGGKTVIAVDLNGLCTKTARRNVILNHFESQMMVVKGDAENFMDLPWDLMVSNIHYDVIRKLLVSKGFLARGHFILSGLLRSEHKAVKDILSTLPVNIIKTWSHEGIWYTIYGRVI